MKMNKNYSTLKADYNYVSLRNTLNMLDRQIEVSIPFARDFCANVAQNPYSLFRFLKTQVTYQDDPPGIELIQSMPSLFLDNYYGVPGMGDCDCFSVAACASMLALGIPTGYTIFGNGKWPTHICADSYYQGQHTYFDLVAPSLGVVKPYKWSESFRLT